jgi:hypothetical protein
VFKSSKHHHIPLQERASGVVIDSSCDSAQHIYPPIPPSNGTASAILVARAVGVATMASRDLTKKFVELRTQHRVSMGSRQRHAWRGHGDGMAWWWRKAAAAAPFVHIPLPLMLARNWTMPPMYASR